MGNNNFSYLFRSGHSLSSAPSAGESRLEPNVEQEQQGTMAVSATRAARVTLVARATVAVGAAGATSGRIGRKRYYHS